MITDKAPLVNQSPRGSANRL